jgi:hypothetical protein
MDISSIYMVVRVPDHELKLITFNSRKNFSNRVIFLTGFTSHYLRYQRLRLAFVSPNC